MDPLSAVGLASSIVQLADAAFKIIKALDTIREGGKERRKLCDEITLLWMTLRNLETQFAPLSQEQNGAWTKPLESLAEPNGVFEQLSKALDEIWAKLTTSESTIGKVKQTLRWPLDQPYVERTVARIEHLKTSIILIEGQASIALAQEMRDDVSAVKKTVDETQFSEIINWLSPLNFRQKQENITPSPGTGAWFFDDELFQSWNIGDDRWLWGYGIPGAGKTFIATSAVTELRKLHQADNALILVAYCSYDSADSQSLEYLFGSLVKQVVQIRSAMPKKLPELYKKNRMEQTRPKLSEILDMLGEAIGPSPKTYIVLDALDEIIDEGKRLTILETLHGLKGSPKIMVTSRKIESIANRFGYPLDGIYCDGCNKKRLDVYWHCEDCVNFDHCEDCRASGERGGHAFIKRFSSIKVRIAAQPEDIESYVNRRIEMEEDLNRMIERDSELRHEILDTIVETAKDMFLLARFHMDSLADCLSRGEVEHALHNLPQEINDTYDQAMLRIDKLKPNRRRAVQRLFLWVSYAKRPLTVQELEHATAVSRGVHEIDQAHIVSAKVLTSLTAGLVIIDENECVRLTHKTAEDYFNKTRSSLFKDGDIEIAECCLAYLQLDSFQSGPCTGANESVAYDLRLKEYPFFAYAATFWGHHARICNSDIVTPQATMFLRSEQLLEASVQAMWYSDTESSYSWDVPGGVDPLHVAAFFGLNDVVSQLIDDGADPNILDTYGTTPLMWACVNGHLEVVEDLLAAGASTDIIDQRGYTALHRTVRNCNIEMTRRLAKETDVAVNAFCTPFYYYTALMIACWHENKDLVDILLARPDIDVNLGVPGTGWNPLLMAASDDATSCVESLLRHPDIEKDYRDRADYTAMHYAAMSGHLKTMDALIDGGEDVDVHHPVHRAVDEGQFEAVKKLLEHGVDYTFVDVLNRSILHAAAINNETQVLRLLLETCKDLDVNHQGSGGETPLHDAAGRGFLATARVLLDFGARTDIQNKEGRTPVRVAKDGGRTHVLGILREAREKEVALEMQRDLGFVRKADTFAIKTEVPLATAVLREDLETLRVRLARTTPEELNNATADFKDTPLHVATKRGVEVVDLLLGAGAFVNPKDVFGRTPLTLACQMGETDTLRSLVKYGADVNISEFGDRPPWELAMKNGNSKAAVYLLSETATEINGQSDQIDKAIGWAAALGDLTACRRLVEADAPLHLKNSNGLTPMQVAKAWDHEEVEKYLFEEGAKQRAASSPQLALVTSATFDDGSTVVEDDEDDEDRPPVPKTMPTFDAHMEAKPTDNEDSIGHPPRRSPTSKKEFMDLIQPIRVQTMPQLIDPSLDLVDKSNKRALLSPAVIGASSGIFVLLLALALQLSGYIEFTGPSAYSRRVAN